MSEQRYAWAPVDAFVAMRWPEVFEHNGTGPGTKDEDMAKQRWHDILGLGYDQFYRWRREDLTEQRADRIATELGVHPSMLWGDWFANCPSDDG